jgi:sec-independent protein translocase protein TatA
MFGLSTREIILIAIILVLLFGAKKLPELARGVAEAVRNLRGGSKPQR